MATQFAVDLVFKTQGDQKLRDLSSKLQGLEGAAKKGQQSLDGASNSIKRTGVAAASATANVQRFGIAFRSVLGPLVAVTGAINFFSRSLGTLGERQADVAALKNGLKGLTTDGNAALESLIASADKLGKQTLFNDEDFRKAFKLLTSFRTIGVSSYERVGTVAADMAQILGQDVSSVMLQVAKALEAPEVGLTALQRSGTRFTDQQKEQVEAMVAAGKTAEAQKFILSELERQYGGAAKAAGSAGFAGAMDSLGESFRDFQESIGGVIEPLAAGFVNGLTAAIDWMNAGYQAVSKLIGAFSPLGEMLDSLGINWDNFGKAAGFAGNVVSVVANDVAYIINQMAQVVADVLGGLFRGIGQFFSGIVDSSAKGMKGVVQNVVNGIRAIRNAIASLINSTPPAMLSKLLGFDVGKTLTAPIGGIANGIEAAFNYGSGVIDRARSLDFGTGGGYRDIVSTGTPDPTKPGGSKGGKGGKDNSADKAAREAELAARQLKAAQDRLFAAEQLLEKQKELSKLEEIELERKQVIARLQREYSELIGKVKSVEEEAALEKARGLEIKAAELEADKAIKELREGALSSIQEENDLLQAKLAGKEEEYQIQKKINDLVKSGGGTVSQGQATALVQANAQMKKQVEAQDKAKASAEALAGSISSALTDSLRGLIDGSMTAEEALSNAFKGIGDAFMDMAMQMIQEWIKMQIIGLIGGLFGGAAGGGTAPGGGWGGSGGAAWGGWNGAMGFEGGGYTGNAPRAGGLDGKGGFPAVLHPGETVIDHRGSAARSALNGGGNGGGAPSMTLNVTATQIADDRWVKVDDLDAAMSKAARQGAAMGERRTLDRLRQSPKTRRTIGL